jgi:hypothetical protein
MFKYWLGKYVVFDYCGDEGSFERFADMLTGKANTFSV